MTPVTPNDPRQFFNVIAFVEGVKLMHIHESRINATRSVGLDAFLVKITFWPLWPQVTPDEFLKGNITVIFNKNMLESMSIQIFYVVFVVRYC